MEDKLVFEGVGGTEMLPYSLDIQLLHPVQVKVSLEKLRFCLSFVLLFMTKVRRIVLMKRSKFLIFGPFHVNGLTIAGTYG